MVDISVIIVNWNARELLRRCLVSIDANHGDLSIEVIVVDSASSDDSVHMVKREFPWVKVAASQQNLGYAGGNNLGAREATGRCLLILNPDTEIVENALQQMVAYLDSHPTVGVVGPRLFLPDGSIQRSCRRFPQLATAFFQTPLGWRWFPNNKFDRMHYITECSDNHPLSVDWLVGAALMIRRETWQQVGPFDDRFFLYSDEVDWCHRCRDAGWEIHYLPWSYVKHDQGGTTRRVVAPARTHFYRSRVLYFGKYFGVGWASIIRLFFLMNYAWLLVEEVGAWAVGRRYETRRQRIQTYWCALKSGLR